MYVWLCCDSDGDYVDVDVDDGDIDDGVVACGNDDDV